MRRKWQQSELDALQRIMAEQTNLRATGFINGVWWVRVAESVSAAIGRTVSGKACREVARKQVARGRWVYPWPQTRGPHGPTPWRNINEIVERQALRAHLHNDLVARMQRLEERLTQIENGAVAVRPRPLPTTGDTTPVTEPLWIVDADAAPIITATTATGPVTVPAAVRGPRDMARLLE